MSQLLLGDIFCKDRLHTDFQRMMPFTSIQLLGTSPSNYKDKKKLPGKKCKETSALISTEGKVNNSGTKMSLRSLSWQSSKNCHQKKTIQFDNGKAGWNVRFNSSIYCRP